jgi:hypothetical protein
LNVKDKSKGTVQSQKKSEKEKGKWRRMKGEPEDRMPR